MFFFSFVLLLFFVLIVVTTPYLGFFRVLRQLVAPYFVTAFGLHKSRPLRAVLAPFLFFFMLVFLVGGFLPYGTPFFTSFRFTSGVRFVFWFRAFLFMTRTTRFTLLLVARGAGFWMTFFLLPIELVREFIKPVSLTVRLYANVLFGHFLIEAVYHFVLVNAGFVFTPVAGLVFVVFELAVFVVQRYIFTFLVVMYLSE
jgi:F-type H+-transporting ATPase subunit a